MIDYHTYCNSYINKYEILPTNWHVIKVLLYIFLIYLKLSRYLRLEITFMTNISDWNNMVDFEYWIKSTMLNCSILALMEHLPNL